MRTLHLIESAHDGHATTGMHSFLSISVHVAIMVAALYATTRPIVEREPVPDTRVYFTPQRPATVAPGAPAAKPVTRKPAASVAEQPKTAPAPSVAPAAVPAVDVPLTDPSVSAPAEPVTGSDVGVAVEAAPGGRAGPYAAGEVEIPAAPLSKSGPEYPERAIRLALSGAVNARFIVGADGRVEHEIVILESSSPDFTAAVRAFLRRARYRPARVGGLAVRQLVEQRFVFELRR